jgi:site-specific recombinase
MCLASAGLTGEASVTWWPGAVSGMFVSAVVGVALVGVLNFVVSFALALVVALRARDVGGGDLARLTGAVILRFLRRPFEFFYPPREPGMPHRAADHPKVALNPD